MIVTVTMNPAVDKTVEIAKLNVGGLNRIQKVEYDAGGKGINVSKTIHELGGVSIATGFLGGSTGRMIKQVLEDKGIQNSFLWVDGETRTNTKIIEADGHVTELNEPGPQITKQQIEALLEQLLSYAHSKTLFVLAGSIPKGVDPSIYERMIRMVHKKGASVLLDADGEALTHALQAKPDILKPNQVELEAYAGLQSGASEEELFAAAKAFAQNGARTIAISRGEKGALFLTEGMRICCPALSVPAHSTVGAGDAMVAALSVAWDQELSPKEMVRLCMATSAGAVMTIGTKPPTRVVVDQLIPQVQMHMDAHE